MNKLINVDVTLCYKISNAEMYGGSGTTGYSEIKYEKIGNLDAIKDEMIESNRQHMADIHEVPVEDVHPITREEYVLATADPEVSIFGMTKINGIRLQEALQNPSNLYCEERRSDEE